VNEAFVEIRNRQGSCWFVRLGVTIGLKQGCGVGGKISDSNSDLSKISDSDSGLSKISNSDSLT